LRAKLKIVRNGKIGTLRLWRKINQLFNKIPCP